MHNALISDMSKTANEKHRLDLATCNIQLRWDSDFGFCLKYPLIHGEYIYLQFETLSFVD